MAKGFEKAGGKCTPTSSGVPQRTVYTGGKAATLSKSIYGKAPAQTSTPRAVAGGDLAHAGSRAAHLIGKR